MNGSKSKEVKMFWQKKVYDKEEIAKIWIAFSAQQQQITFLESNLRILTQKINKKLGKLPTEEREERSKEEKDFYRGVLLPE